MKGQLTPEAAAFEAGFNVGRMAGVTPKDPATVLAFAKVVLPKRALEFAAGVQAGIEAIERGRADDDELTKAWTRYKVSIAEPVRCRGCGRYDCYSLACKWNVED